MDHLLDRFCNAYDVTLQNWDSSEGGCYRMYLCGVADSYTTVTGNYTLSHLATELIIRHSAQFLASIAK